MWVLIRKHFVDYTLRIFNHFRHVTWSFDLIFFILINSNALLRHFKVQHKFISLSLLVKTGPHVRQQLCYQLTHCLLWIDCDTSENLCLTCWIFHKILKGISPALFHSSASKTHSTASRQQAQESTTIIMVI